MALSCRNNKADHQAQDSQLPPIEPSKIFNNYKLARYNKLFDSILGKIFMEHVRDQGWTVTDLQSPRNLAGVYNGIQAEMRNMLIDKYSDDGIEWKRLSDEVASDMNTIADNFDVFAKEHMSYNNLAKTKGFNINEDYSDDDTSASEITEGENDEDEDTQLEYKGKEFDRGSNDQAQIDLASNEVKTLFRLLPKAVWNASTGQSDKVYDRDGLPLQADYMKVWNLLAEIMAGEKDEETFKYLLESDQTAQIVPEVKFLNEFLRIDKPNAEKSTSEVDQFIKFWQTFSKPKIPLQSAYMGSDGVFSLQDEILGNRQKIEINFNNNFISGRFPQQFVGFVKKSDTGVYYLHKESDTDTQYLPELEDTDDSRMDFLRLLGFQFSGLENLSEKEMDNFKEMIDTASTRLHNSLKKRLEADIKVKDAEGNIRITHTQIREPIRELRKKQGKIPSEASSIKKLIAFESKHSTISPTHSTRNAMGEMQHLINQDTAISITTYHLNAAASLEDLMRSPSFKNAKYNPQFRTSYAIKFLFGEDGNKIAGRSIETTLLSGFKKKEESGKTVVKLERNLSERSKIIQDFNNFHVNGRTDTMRTETSNSFFSLGFSNNGEPQLYTNPKGFTTSFIKDRAFKNQILDYLNGEIRRIASFQDKKRDNPTLPAEYGDFSIFSELSDDMKDKLKKNGEVKEDDEITREFLNEYNSILNQELQNFKNTLDENGISTHDLLSQQLREMNLPLDALARAFIAGTQLQNIEFSILYSGDTLFYKEMQKRLKGLSSTGNILANLPMLSAFRESQDEINNRERYSFAAAMKKQGKDNTDNFKTQVMVEPVSTNSEYTKPEMATNIARSLYIRDGKKVSEEEIRQGLKGGQSINIADGQGWINPDFYRHVMRASGYLTPEMEAVLRYEGLLLRRDILDLELTQRDKTELNNLERLIYSNPSQYALPVVKGTYWGNIENSTVDAKAFDKFSIAPLLPSYIKTKPYLKNLLLSMVTGDYGYIKYPSGSKLFKTTPVASLDGAKADIYTSQLFKVQIKPDGEQKKFTTLLTQALKLAFTNLMSEAKGVTDNIDNLYKRYVDTFNQIKQEQRRRVLKELGYKYDTYEEDGTPVVTSFDPVILSKKLIREAKNRQLNSNILSALELDSNTGEFATDLDSSGFLKEVNDLIGGILDRSLRRYEFPGGDFTMVSNVNQGKLQHYQFSETGTEPMEIRLTLNTEYSKLLNKVHPDGRRIGTLERLNALVKRKDWIAENKKSLLVLIGRAPVDGPHSMGIGRVVEFLPPTMGNVIIQPDEVIFQGGPDFDYDKQKVITPYFDQYGNYLTKNPGERLQEVIKKLNEFQDQYPELKRLSQVDADDETGFQSYRAGVISGLINNIFDTDSEQLTGAMNDVEYEISTLLEEYRNLKSDLETVKTNSIIELYHDILMSPEMYAELVSPSSTEDIQKLAEKIGKNTGASVELPRLGRALYYSENLKVFKTYLANKNLLATFAKENTSQQLMAYSGINMNEKYNNTVYDKKSKKFIWKPEKINTLLLSETERDKVIKNGQFLTSLRDDINGYIKQHYNSQGIQATVDAAKDPFIDLLKLTLQNIGVVHALKEQGVPFERIINFINHPILQLYFTNRDNGMNQAESLEDIARNRLNLRYTTKQQRAVDQQLADDYLQSDREDLIERGLLDEDSTFEMGKDVYGDVVTFTKTVYPNVYQIKDILKDVDNGGPVKVKGFDEKATVMDLNKFITYEHITPGRFEEMANPKNDRVANKSKNTKEQQTKDFSDEMRVLAHFIALEKVSFAMRDFREYFNNDTAKTSTLAMVRAKQKLDEKLRNQNLFSQEDINRMKNDSVISGFRNDNLVSQVFSHVFPVLASPEVQDGLADIYNEYNNNFRIKNKRDLRNLPNTLNNDFLTSIIHNFAEVDGNSLFDYAFPLIIRRRQSDETFADKLAAFKDKDFYPELSRQYPILDSLIASKLLVQEPHDPNGLPKAFVLENVQLIKNAQETMLEQEDLIYQLKDIYYSYTGPNQNEVFAFVNELFLVGIIQSGFSKSFISYSEYIPFDFTRKLYSKAIGNFKKLSALEREEYMEKFYDSFKANNPRYFPQIAKKIPNTNKYWFRFKYYRFDDNETPLPEVETAPEAPPAPEAPTFKTESGHVKISKHPWSDQKKGLGISTLRSPSARNLGNPFGTAASSEFNIIRTKTGPESVQSFKDWLTTDKYKDVEPERRQWLIDNIKAGTWKGKTLLYYTELNRPSHANVLDELINNTKEETQPKEKKTRKKKVEVAKPDITRPDFEKFKVDMIDFIRNVKDSSFDWRLTVPTLTQAEREKAIDDISKGKKTARVKKLLKDLEGMYNQGVVTMNRGRGNQAETRDVPFSDYYNQIKPDDKPGINPKCS